MPEIAFRPAAARPTAGLLAVLVTLTALSASLGVAPSAEAAAPSDSAVTISAADYYQQAWHTDAEREAAATEAPFPDLTVTVSQTRDLIQQGVTISWTGGRQSTVPNAQIGGTNFLQIAQCWGDEPGSNGTRPDRTTCQYGGLNAPSDSRWSLRSSNDAIATEDASYTAEGADWTEPTQTAIPFVSYTGVTVASIVEGRKVDNPSDLNTNEFFTKYTTNEISWAGSAADGTGSVSFELQTAQQSPGLGCGTALTASDGEVTGSSCWLVVIPRGTHDPNRVNVSQSGLFWESWKHHLAVRLEFKPAGLRCAIGTAERQLSGSELISGAVGQWQPRLCRSADGAVYSLLTGPESAAALTANGTGSAPLALTSRALDIDDVTDNLAYAPLTVAGISLAFAIDRQADVNNSSVPDEVLAKERQSFATLKLTPRLLAKLLTASYTDALPTGADKSHISSVRNITQDPEFLAINDPEWKYMRIVGAGVGDAMVPLGRSDSARTVWEYIMADEAAAAFLGGEADNIRKGDEGNSGMKVNPHYSTSAKVNPTGAGLELPRDDFPKADPVEFPGFANHDYDDVVNLVTWRPYTSSLDNSAYLVLRGDAQVLGDWDAASIPPKYGKAPRALVGLQAVTGVTSTFAAARYQVVQAALLNPAGEYVAPTDQSLAAAAEAMTTVEGQSQVVEFDYGSAAATRATNAYPLTVPVYAAASPAMSDADLRADYAAFITFAVTDGQTRGTDDGELPPGYAPLPKDWKTQALAAAAAIRDGGWPTPSPTPTPTPTPSSSPTATAGDSPQPQQSVPYPSTTPSSQPPVEPLPSGSTAGPLIGTNTPDDPPLGALAAAVPATGLVGLAAALGIPAVSRLRRSP